MDVAMVCCALHNVAERWAGINDVCWLQEPNDNAVVGNVGPEDNGEGIAIRNSVAKFPTSSAKCTLNVVLWHCSFPVYHLLALQTLCWIGSYLLFLVDLLSQYPCALTVGLFGGWCCTISWFMSLCSTSSLLFIMVYSLRI